MSLILNIDTATEKAHVSFAKDGLVIHSLSNESQKEHASFLQAAIRELIKISGTRLADLDAVAVTSGPGSYTGLRVGMSSAKGLCYALKKPLITIGTLEVLANSAIELFPFENDRVLYCPMIDARRMEIFTAIYNRNLEIFMKAGPVILDEFSFKQALSENKILFFGSGSVKWRSICRHENACFKNVSILPQSISKLTNALYLKNHFTELAYSEPLYLKEFQTVVG